MKQKANGHSMIEDWLASQGTQPKPQAETQEMPLLSVVIPAYNEEWRLPFALIDTIDFLEGRQDPYEIIVVDDGSSDNTAGVVRKFHRICPRLKLLQLPCNSGKGCAVRNGILEARAPRIIFVDADGAAPISEITRLERALSNGADAAIGSRAIPTEQTRVVTHWHRKYLGRAFNCCINLLLLPKIADTQCGFKMFTSQAARFLFSRQQANGFSFDVEILHIARRAGLRVDEVPINWTNVPGSKVNLFLDPLRMFFDIMCFGWRHRRINQQSWSGFLHEVSQKAG